MKIRRKGKRRWRTLLVGGLIILVAAGGYNFWLNRKLEHRLRKLRDAGYPISPEELNTWYEQIPNAENAALIYTQAFSHIVSIRDRDHVLPPWGYPGRPPPGKPLSGEMERTTRDVLAGNRGALGLLKKGRSRKRSRYPIDFT